MKASKIKEFLERWEALFARQGRLDFELCVLMRDVRAEWPLGTDVEDGDAEMLGFCEQYFEQGGLKGRELLTYALAGAVFKDAKAYEQCGGRRAARNLALLPRTAQVAMMLKAKSEAKSINTVLRERGASAGEAKDRVKPAQDARLLADFINKSVKNVPPPIRAIIARYVKLAQDRASE